MSGGDRRRQPDVEAGYSGFPRDETPVDIKPGSFPNPLNVKSRGVLPVAILGSTDFDVMTIDPLTVRLNGALRCG